MSARRLRATRALALALVAAPGVASAADTPVSATLTVIATCDAGSYDLQVGGLSVVSAPAIGDCTCDPTPRTVTTTDPAVLAQLDAPLCVDLGMFLINMQMLGMLVGGVVWGVLGDKRGRLSVLFGSILMYSLANIAKT